MGINDTWLYSLYWSRELGNIGLSERWNAATKTNVLSGTLVSIPDTEWNNYAGLRNITRFSIPSLSFVLNCLYYGIIKPLQE